MNEFKDFRDIFASLFGNAQKVDESTSEEDRLAISKSACERKCALTNEQEGNINSLDGYDCPKCKNRGFFYEPLLCGNYYDVSQRFCDCMKARKAIRALKRSGLGDLIYDFRFDNFETKELWQKSAYDKAKRYADDNGGKWFFIGGASGRGKTHLCTAIAVSIIKKNFDVKYMLWRDESRRLKSMVNDPSYIDEMEILKSVDVLYIDDLFKTGKGADKAFQRPTEADINLAFEIISNRDIRKKPTIISSECTMMDLYDIDESICGRIKRNCGDFCVNIGANNTKNYRFE